MENNGNNIPLSVYDEQQTTIDGIKFTHREIDIITSIFHLRGASKIATLLSISTRTVESHTANIMRKMDANSREGIIDFVERSGHSPWINNHYQNLLIKSEFKKLLREVLRIARNKSLVGYIVFEPEETENEYFHIALKEHLSLCDIKTVLIESSEKKSIIAFLPQEELSVKTHIIYIVPRRLIEQFQIDKDEKNLEISSLGQKTLLNLGSLIFLINSKTQIDIPKELFEIGYVCFYKQDDYYSSFFKILRRILPDTNLDKIISSFEKRREAAKIISDEDSQTGRQNSKRTTKKDNIFKSKMGWVVAMSVIIIGTIYFGVTNSKNYVRSIANQNNTKSTHSVRSDLVIPAVNAFLNRPNIITKLVEGLKDNGGIQTVALVGIGGAGKTTIARNFALQQNANVVWEINAATRQSLKDSFERLAYALCKSEKEKEILQGLQVITNKIEKDEKILLFVKDKLKSNSNWFLIYDNVEKFTDIQKYFPCDSTVWGKGKIIVTTSNSNAKNNNFINNFIQVGELSPEEKLSLFIKIMGNGSSQEFTPAQKERAITFLNDVPPYPLDISIAAYYLKSTNTPYIKYLERLKEDREDFDNIQVDVVKEASGYTKTRYGIISVSLKELINTHKDFGALLLLVSLINNQSIPRALLANYKGDTIVDNFIYHLKKYSLITSESFSDPIPNISIHSKTQEIILSYLIKTLSLSSSSPFLHSITSTLESYIVDALDKEDFSRMKLLVIHCETLLNHDDLLDETMKSSLGGALGCMYYYLKHNLKTKQLLEENLANLRHHYGDNHEKIARILVYLGNFYRALGDYERAQDLLEQSLAICKINPNYLRSAKALGYLGAVYRDLGEYKKAKVLLEQSLAIYEKYSVNHIGHAWILAYLGNIYRILGDYNKAKELLEQSLSIYKRQSEDYVGVAWVLGYLGTVYKSLGDYEKAKNSHEQSLFITRKYFSDDHIYVASRLASLADVYIGEGNYQKAKSLLKGSLAIFESNYGKNHIETAHILRILGEAYYLEGDLETSEDFINKSLLVFQQKSNPESYKSLVSLADLYMKRATQSELEGDIKQAQSFNNQSINYLEQALKITKDYFDKDSPHIAKIQSKMNTLSSFDAVSKAEYNRTNSPSITRY